METRTAVLQGQCALEDISDEIGKLQFDVSLLSEFDTDQFISNEFAQANNLSEHRWQFDKVELVGSDVIVLIETWYSRASVLPCQPETRQTFHFLLLLEALTGCRPGCLGDLKWGDFTLFLLRDPHDPSKIHPGVDISLRRNKQLQGSMFVKEK